MEQLNLFDEPIYLSSNLTVLNPIERIVFDVSVLKEKVAEELGHTFPSHHSKAHITLMSVQNPSSHDSLITEATLVTCNARECVEFETKGFGVFQEFQGRRICNLYSVKHQYGGSETSKGLDG